MDPLALIALLVLGLCAWPLLRRRAAGRGPSSGKTAKKTDRSSGTHRKSWRQIQDEGTARTRARNRGAPAAPRESDGAEKLGRAHRKRLIRKAWPGPWR